MEYTIHALSRLSGVTTRTLRWYDKIGLLKPSRIAAGGCRCYGQAEVDRLQDILYYRALGVELARIKACLDDPSFDRLAALRGHLAALEEQRARLDGLIQSVKDTISAQERNEQMSDEKKFEALKREIVDRHESAYGREAREMYGDRKVDAAQQAVLHLTEEQYEEWTELDREILSRLEKAVLSGQTPESETGREIAALHRRWLVLGGSRIGAAEHRGIAALYTEDPRFAAYYDKAAPGAARFLCETVQIWADRI